VTSHRLILHVGAPKCGSSSLQVALSQDPDFESRSGERFRYAAIKADGRIVTGDTLRRSATGSIVRYEVSANTPELGELDETTLATTAGQLRDLVAGTSIILSCEGWLERAADFDLLNLLRDVEADVEIVAFVRPQVDFLNAGWWQWGAWSPFPLNVWLYFADMADSWKWAKLLRAWSAVRGVTAIHARLASEDVVAGFFDAIRCDRAHGLRQNRSLPPVAVRFLQRHRELRPDPHSSDIDFVLGNALSDCVQPAPWVIPPDYATYVIEASKADNETLLDMLPAAQRDAMLADPRWWNPAVYTARTAVTPDPLPPDPGELDALSAALAKALQRAENELAVLRARLASDQ